MRKSLLVGTLAAMVGLVVGCSSDDNAAPSTSAGSGGSGGGSGASGTAGRGTGGTSAGASGAGIVDGAGGSGGGSGGVGNSGGGAGTAGGMAGNGGTGIVDPCDGKNHALPVPVSSLFTTVTICSSGTCTTPPMPYFFTQIPNPNCDEAFPDGGIVPPFPDPGIDAGGGTDAGSDDATASDASDGSEAGPPSADDADAGALESGTPDGSADAGVNVDGSVNADVSVADVSVNTEAGADVSSDAHVAEAGDAAAPPSCYEFLYNPYCTTGTCWGGVIFTQSPGGIADPGVCIEPGATKITFQAKASRPGARIKFGSIREGMGATEFFLNVTTEWAPYEVTIPAGEPYNSYSAGGTGVWNGFSVIVEPQDHPGGTYIFVKDAVWVK